MDSYMLLTILYIVFYCESATIFQTNEHKPTNCFIECTKNQNCFNDITSNTNVSNSCNNLTIHAQYSLSVVLKIDSFQYPNLSIYLPSTITNKLHIYSNSKVLLQNNQFNSNNIQLYCQYNETLNKYTSSCILWQCLDTNHICNRQIQIHHKKHQRQLLTSSSTIQPTVSTSDSQTGFMKLLNQAKQINFIFYIIGGLILSICCVSCCCLYYFYHTHRAARKLKQLNVVLPKSPVSPSVGNTTNSAHSPSQNSEMIHVKFKSNESVVESKEPVGDVEISHTQSKKSIKNKSGMDYNYNNNNNNNNKFGVNHNVNNNNYMPQKRQQMKYMQTQSKTQPHIQHYKQSQQQLVQNHSFQPQPSHRNTVTISNVNNNNNNWNDNRNGIHHPHRNTVAVTSNIYTNNQNNNMYNNASNMQYQRNMQGNRQGNMHINVIPPQQSNNNNVPPPPQQSNNIPPPPPPIPKPSEHMSTIRVIVNDDDASDITHITSSTFGTLNTEDFENDNSQSVSSSEIDNNKHTTQKTNDTIDTLPRQMTYATHTETESGGEETHNIIQPLDELENELDNELEKDDEKKHIIEHNEGNNTKHIPNDSSETPLRQVSIANSGHSVDEDGGMYMKLKERFNNNESALNLTLDNQPSRENSVKSAELSPVPEHSPQVTQNTMVINKSVDTYNSHSTLNNNHLQKTYSYDAFQL